MTGLIFALSISSQVLMPKPFNVQFVQGSIGQNVSVSIDGKRPHMTFAGKLGFRDQNRTWTSVCGDVRAPISNGQRFSVRTFNSSKLNDRLKLAGNIVAKYFDWARTPDQCAGLQLAVWEAIEDGGKKADFQHGRFRGDGTLAVLKFADEYYDAIFDDADAIYLQSGGGGQGQFSSTT